MGDLTINIEAYTVFVGTEKIPMTKKEVETMWILAKNPSKVFTRDNLLDSLWGQDYFGDSRTVDSHIKRLRAKLDKVEHPDWEQGNQCEENILESRPLLCRHVVDHDGDFWPYIYKI